LGRELPEYSTLYGEPFSHFVKMLVAFSILPRRRAVVDVSGS
jgi:hypothetical protein